MSGPRRKSRILVCGLVLLGLMAGLGPPPAVATFSGTNGKIFFSSFRDGNFEIYRMKPSGAGQTNLTNDPADDYAAAASQDGSKIAFVSERDGDPEIFVMNADGSEPTQLTSNGTQDFGPEFTPDGRIVFVSDRDGNFEIYIMDLDGQNQTRLTSNTAIDLEPTVSPDGTLIAWASFRDFDYEIFTMGIDGSNEVQLTSNTVTDGTPDFAPDGQSIAFTSFRDGDFEIYRMGVDGSNQTRLTNSPGLDFGPSHSPNGLRLMWASARTGDIEIWVGDLPVAAAGPSSSVVRPLGLLGLPEQLTDSSGIDAEVYWARKPRADLRTRKTCPETAEPGERITCTISVKNLGPDTAGRVIISDDMSGEGRIRKITADVEGATCVVQTRFAASCLELTLAPGETVTVEVVIYALRPGRIDNQADAFHSTGTTLGNFEDPNPDNNRATDSTRIIRPG